MNRRFVYHITHIRNLPTIIENGLQSDNLVDDYTCIGDRGIKNGRKEKTFRFADGSRKAVADFVPFYFAPRSPMLFKISRGGVEGYEGKQERVIYLVCRRSSLWERYRCCGTNQNAATDLAQFCFDDESLCSAIDWELMSATMWNNTAEYPDRMQKRMAEFLVLDRVDFEEVRLIAVMNKKMREQVLQILESSGVDCKVVVEPDWYYD